MIRRSAKYKRFMKATVGWSSATTDGLVSKLGQATLILPELKPEEREMATRTLNAMQNALSQSKNR